MCFIVNDTLRRSNYFWNYRKFSLLTMVAIGKLSLYQQHSYEVMNPSLTPLLLCMNHDIPP